MMRIGSLPLAPWAVDLFAENSEPKTHLELRDALNMIEFQLGPVTETLADLIELASQTDPSDAFEFIRRCTQALLLLDSHIRSIRLTAKTYGGDSL